MGTGPFYDVKTNNLYYVDKSMTAQVYRYDLTTETFTTGRLLGEGGLSFIFPVEGTKNEFIVGAGKRLLLVTWDGFQTTLTIKRVLVELPTTGLRFNDAKTDSRGRLYVGTMIDGETGNIFDFTKRVGSLYTYTMTEGLVELRGKVGFGNGICFNEKTGTMYFVDSYDLNIKQYMWDIKTGKISGEKIFTDLTQFGTPKTVFPDGLTIDVEGFIYCAMFGGSKVLRINPTNGKVTEIPFPVEQITSMTFGGKTFDSMYCTTSAMDNTRFTEGVKPTNITYPNGYLFRIKDMGVIGTEFYNFKTTA
jgi:gluconolactonase